ncbi:Enolase-phosphatase [Tolypocladium capitatum]|uniref:Enolase-phosphatase n=1 Tax=Tolypocladium capitatum TaxID=45235 RepID=A0A2K3QEG4_9HYPO|nr:Enolase-phosphatase [Tolypocladium capitatum]
MAAAAAAGFADFDVLVLDIEGTVCPISFVHDVLFPYALDALPRHLDSHWDSPGFARYRDAFPDDCRNDRAAFHAHVHHLVARDVKAPYLKALQGHLWQQGYESGELEAPIFPDVAPLIIAAHGVGKKIIIYSSGSVPAQKLFFAHTTARPSDLAPFISAWFDTVNAGPKTETASYTTILSSHPTIPPARWLFLSDNLREVSAALASGMRSLPVTRPGNAPLPPDNPLSQLAIADLSPKSAERVRESLAALDQLPKPDQQ